MANNSSNLVVVNLPDRSCGHSKSKLERKGLRRGSIRQVTGTDPGAKGGYQLRGPFLDGSEAELRAGSVVAFQTVDRNWKIGVVMPYAKISWVTDEIDGSRMVTIRKAAEAVLESPAAAYTIIRDRRKEKLAESERSAEEWASNAAERPDCEWRAREAKSTAAAVERARELLAKAEQALADETAGADTERAPAGVLEGDLEDALILVRSGKYSPESARELADTLRKWAA